MQNSVLVMGIRYSARVRRDCRNPGARLKFYALIAAISRNSRPGGGVIGASHEGGPMGSRNPKKPAAVAKAAEMVVQRLEERRMMSVSLHEKTWMIEVKNDQNHVI